MDDDQPTRLAQPADRGNGPEGGLAVEFDRYELLAEVGKGGMGVVWLARDRELNSKVALKFLREEMTSDAGALRALKDEVLLNRDLSHPNIIKTFDFLTSARRSAISMEYVFGTNLNNLKATRAGGVFDADDIAPWVFQLCDAMDYAHRRKIIHRDLKPANLMIDEGKELKIGDFGIGRTVADTVNRVTHSSAGTPPFMSPQQMMGEKAIPADDIYGIGATIYDLLTGNPPFFRGSISEQTLGKVPPPMTARRRELNREGRPIPPNWEQAAAACLAKDAADRPPTARHLKDLLEGKPVVISSGNPARAARKRLGWAIAAASSAAVLVALWRLGTVTPSRESSAANARTQPPPAQAQPVQEPRVSPAAQAAARTPAVEAATIAPKSPVDELVDRHLVTPEEGAALKRALAGEQGDAEKTLATRAVNTRAITLDEWRRYTGLAAPANDAVSRLRPLLAAGLVREAEFGWLESALSGQKGDPERVLAGGFVVDRTLSPEQWRAQTGLYPHPKPDPLMEKIQPLIAAGSIVDAEVGWLRASLAGDKGASEKVLSERLVTARTISVAQWRSRTAFGYAQPDDALDNPAKLPPAIDLPLGATVTTRLLRVDPGEYIRGAPDDEIGRRPNEKQQKVQVASPFFLGAFEVTQSEFMAVMDSNPSYWRGNPTWPVDQVTWSALAGSNGFLERLNRSLRGRFHGKAVAVLPTEDQWEYACRADTQSSFNNGRNISDAESDPALDPLANYNRADSGSPASVGSFLPNAWGFYDMHGNVAEWCSDRFIRGGSWRSPAADCRAAWRTQMTEDASPSNQIGFRLALSLKAAGD